MQFQIYKSLLKEVLVDNYINNYVKGLNNVMAELRNVRAMRSGVPPWGMGNLKVLYDTTVPLKYTGKYVKFEGKTYKEIWLPKDEYGHVVHEINNNLTEIEASKKLLYRQIGNYEYKFIYINFNNYIIVGKEIIK